MADSAADVPNKYDILIDGFGYIFAREIDPNVPFRTQRGKYSWSPTFVTRQNVSGNFGDNQQDFWLTFTQKDWSGGEGLRFARANDASKQAEFWASTGVNVETPGQVTPRRPSITGTLAGVAKAATNHTDGLAYVATLLNLETVDLNGTTASLGAHAAGAVVAGGVCSDGTNVFVAGSSALRKYNAGFTTFGAGIYATICFQNNTLYGAKDSSIFSIDTAGTATTIFTFKDATGTSSTFNRTFGRIIPYGGQVAALTGVNWSGNQVLHPECWVYDGTSVKRLCGFPKSFTPLDMCVSNEILFFVGYESDTAFGTRTAVYFYNNGSVGCLWRDATYTSSLSTYGAAIEAYGTGIVFSDNQRGVFHYYNLDAGAVSTMATYTGSSFAGAPFNGPTLVAITPSHKTSLVYAQSGSTTVYVFPKNTTATVSPTVTSSLIDFETSLPKYVRGVTIDGTGVGTVDLAYQLDDLDGAWTNFATGAVAGTEYPINQTCHSIGIRATLNNVGFDNTPILKRMYVRAVPVETSYRNDEVILDCTGKFGKTPVILNTGNAHGLHGEQMIANLRTSILKTVPISITDFFGTYTGIIEPETVEIIHIRPREFYARVTLREV